MALSILVVDDYPENTEIMGYILDMFGHRSASAHDGETALKMLREGQYDLLITDDRMGVMSGFDLAAAVRADPTLPQLPILLISGYQYEGNLEQRMRECGINAFLPRPHTPETLENTIQALVKRPSDA